MGKTKRKKQGGAARNGRPPGKKVGRGGRPAERTSPEPAGNGWGGRRPGAGRKRTGPVQGGPHRERPDLDGKTPVLVTLLRGPGLKSFRAARTRTAIHRALGAGAGRNGLGLVCYRIQADHLQLICEPEDRDALSEGMKGLGVRLSKAINATWERQGSVFPERFIEALLDTPAKLERTLAELLGDDGGVVDPGSSRVWDDPRLVPASDDAPRPVPARTARLRRALGRWRSGR